MGFDLSQYEEVKDRIPRFWEKYEDGTILTEILEHDSRGEPESWVVKATLKTRHGQVIATGLAQEHATERGVNATSALENCETSAIGRALANAGFSAGKNRPSREEMRKADRGGGSSGATAGRPAGPGDRPESPPRSTSSTRLASEKQRKFINMLVDKTGMVPQTWPLPDDLDAAEASRLIDWLNEQPVEPPAERVKTLRKDAEKAAEEFSDAPF